MDFRSVAWLLEQGFLPAFFVGKDGFWTSSEGDVFYLFDAIASISENKRYVRWKDTSVGIDHVHEVYVEVDLIDLLRLE